MLFFHHSFHLHLVFSISENHYNSNCTLNCNKLWFILRLFLNIKNIHAQDKFVQFLLSESLWKQFYLHHSKTVICTLYCYNSYLILARKRRIITEKRACGDHNRISFLRIVFQLRFWRFVVGVSFFGGKDNAIRGAMSSDRCQWQSVQQNALFVVCCVICVVLRLPWPNKKR